MKVLNGVSGVLLYLLGAVLQAIQRSSLLQRVLDGILIASFFAVALYLRIALSHEVVFGGAITRFTGVDAYWHIRIIDNLAHNFPHLNSMDPYMMYPGGGGTSVANPFFDYLLAGIIWVIGLGSPTQHTVDMIAPYFPPVLGALTIIPAYFIGKTLFSRWAGVIAAGLVAILPGEFLGRSILGFTDHHVAETLFSATAVMFLILALKNAKKEKMTWSQLRHPNSSGLTKAAVYGLLGGVGLGIYLISWMGALLFVFIIAAFFLVQFCVDHFRRVPTDYLCLVGVATFLPALVMYVLVSRDRNTTAVLAIALLVPVVLFAASRLMSSKGLKPLYYPMAVVGLGLAAFGILYAAAPSLAKPMLDHLEIFKWNRGTTVAEMVPVLYDRLSSGELEFSLRPLWQVYGFSILFGVVALCILAYSMIRRWEPEKVLVILWTLVILLATLGQRRFNYYLVVNVALLTGYLSWEILRLAGLRQLVSEPGVESGGRKKSQRSKGRKESQQRSYRLTPSHAYVSLAAIVLLSLFTVLPYTEADLYGTGRPRWVSAIDYAKATARLTPDQPRYAPSDAWCESLTWLREYTPEPFGDPDFYYARYDTPFDYSNYPNAYGVMAWWDYGYWIVRIGHRPPSQNPGGAIPAVAEFFLAQDESEGQRILDERGARYVILDYDFVTGKFYGAISVTGKSQEDFYDSFLVEVTDSQGQKKYQLIPLYFPAYFRSMSVRLYSFDGKAVVPKAGDCKVVTWTWQEIEGVRYKMVTKTQPFNTYEEALAFVARQSSGNYNIVSSDPLVSPVPLDELKDFVLRHDSEIMVTDTIPQIRIFEYVK
jgi:oligosaccharyl transferase (archaeosortase A-associated)